MSLYNTYKVYFDLQGNATNEIRVIADSFNDALAFVAENYRDESVVKISWDS